MKKAAVLMLAAVLCLMASASMAVSPSMPYDPALSLRWQLLTGPQQALFDLLYEALWRGDASVTFDAPVRYDDIDPVMSVLQLDQPELCAVGYSYAVSYHRDEPDIATGIRFTYDMPIGTQPQLLGRAAQLLDGLPDEPGARVRAIHDTVCALTDYQDAPHAHNAYGALTEGRSVCDGSTKALVLLLRLSGVPCSMVTGTAVSGGTIVSHSWCILQMGDTFTQIDIVWDDQPDGIRYGCYLVGDTGIAADHTRDTDSLRLPKCEDVPGAAK